MHWLIDYLLGVFTGGVIVGIIEARRYKDLHRRSMSSVSKLLEELEKLKE